MGCPAAPDTAASIRVVDEVVRLGAELETCFLGNGECLEQSDVPVLESRLVDKVADPLCVKRSGSWLGVDLGGRRIIKKKKDTDHDRRSGDNPGLAIVNDTKREVCGHSW